jgi:hypothetical protein
MALVVVLHYGNCMWRSEVMDLMIQMKSLNCFMDDTNYTLNEFTVAVDV